MSLHRRNPRRDANEAEIMAALQAIGVKVWPISGEGIPDLLCLRGGRFYLLECKTRSGRVTDAQARFFEAVGDAPAYIVKSAEEALEALR